MTGKGRLRHRDLPPRPGDGQALLPWLRALSRVLIDMELDAAHRVLKGLGVRLRKSASRDPWPSPLVGEGIPFNNAIWVKADGDDKIIAVHVDAW